MDRILLEGMSFQGRHGVRPAEREHPQAFKVDVVDVNTMTVRGKERRLGRRIGRRPDWKKAIVTIAAGQKIERYFVEGV